MAEWIRVQVDSGNDPRMIAMSRCLGVTTHRVLGALIQVWSRFGRFGIHGENDPTPDQVDAVAGQAGFFDAMAKAGLLV